MSELTADITRWTETERWVWDQIVSGQVADLNQRDFGKDKDIAGLDPRSPDGWSEKRRIRSDVLRHFITDENRVKETPFSGVRIFGALIDDAPINLEYSRLSRLLWLDRSRLLVPFMARNLRVDGGLSLEESFVAGDVTLQFARIEEALCLAAGTFKGNVNVGEANIGTTLVLSAGVFHQNVCLNGVVVRGAAFLRQGAVFKKDLDISYASVGSGLDMQKSYFERSVSMDGIKVGGSAFLGHIVCSGNLSGIGASVGGALELHASKIKGDIYLNRIKVEGPTFMKNKATFWGDLDLGGSSIGGGLELQSSTFFGSLNLNGVKVAGPLFFNREAIFLSYVDMRYATIGASLNMRDSIFYGNVDLTGVEITSRAALSDASFKSNITLSGAKIGSTLDLCNSDFRGLVELTAAKIGGEFRLGSSEDLSARWSSSAKLVLRNAQCGAWQDRGGSDASSWPPMIDIEGFTYGRLGGLGGSKSEARMLSRPVASYAKLFRRDPAASPHPYEQLAQVFRAAGEPSRANDILYEARERRRADLLVVSRHPNGGWLFSPLLRWLGLSLLKWTIGYGLGLRYFRALFWVFGISVLGMILLKSFGQQTVVHWWPLFFISLDELLPVITLDRAHEAILSTASKSMQPTPVQQPFWLIAYFYIHKIIGWVIGSFLVAGLAGLTQKT